MLGCLVTTALLAFSPGLKPKLQGSSTLLAAPDLVSPVALTAAVRSCRIVAFEGGGGMKPRSDAEIAAIFSEFDTSGDGFIDLDELQAALTKAGKPVSQEEAAKILKEVDENGDGQISLAEFKKVFSLSPGSAPDVLASVLDLFSLDNLLGDLGMGGQWRRTESGAKYVDDVIGTGKLIVAGDFVQMHYTVTSTVTGSVVETSRGGRPLGYLIGESDGSSKSWDDGVSGMRVGGQRRVYVGPEGDEPRLRYDIEIVALESASSARREELIAALGGRRSVTRALFALTFIPYFIPEDKLPPFLEWAFVKDETDGEQAQSDKVSREDQYVAKSLDALFPGGS